MLLDGYWKKDLLKIKKQLERWGKFRSTSFDKYAEHKINQGLLYSAVIIRKIIDDEKDGEKEIKEANLPLPKFYFLDYSVPVIEYKHNSVEKFFSVSQVFPSDYDMKNARKTTVELKELCNQFIHSYVWGVVNNSDRGIFGVMFASDKKKEEVAYLLKINDWIETIRYVAENCNINSKE